MKFSKYGAVAFLIIFSVIVSRRVTKAGLTASNAATGKRPPATVADDRDLRLRLKLVVYHMDRILHDSKKINIKDVRCCSMTKQDNYYLLAGEHKGYGVKFYVDENDIIIGVEEYPRLTSIR